MAVRDQPTAIIGSTDALLPVLRESRRDHSLKKLK